MTIKDKIKEELLKELYTDIDKLYDFMQQHFELSSEHEQLIIRDLNKLKDQIYLVSSQSKLS
ncbi:MAG TPA: hypothetical protein ENK72_01485 [Epsilonproteobacteria bacterium]|jgi:hypothetical protein|nr:hypothetical protein [Campylobacterota bacterium]